MNSIIITLSTAVLYCFGLTFYRGYIRQFGLLESQFPLTFDRTIFEGFYCMTYIAAKPILYFFLAAQVLILTAILVKYILRYANNKGLSFKSLSNSTQPVTEQRGGFVGICSMVLIYSALLLVVYVGIVTVLVFSEQSGKSAAQSVINSYKNRCYKTSSIVQNNGNRYSNAYLVACNQKESAYLVGNETIVLKTSEVALSITP